MSLTSLHFHVVFSTKERRPLINYAIRPDLHTYIGGIVRELNAKPVIIGGVADHVHLLISLPAALSVADCLRVVKANSSRWMNERGHVFSWQTGYSAFTVSTSLISKVADYIRGQEEHHKKHSFQEELLALLQKHGVSFDEKYLWN